MSVTPNLPLHTFSSTLPLGNQKIVLVFFLYLFYFSVLIADNSPPFSFFFHILSHYGLS